MEIQINRNELYEALCARLGYAQKKAELNAGKKYEQKWKESAAHVKEVIAWILDHDRYTINLVAHDADQAAALSVGELSPIEVKTEELSPMTNEDLEAMTEDLPLSADKVETQVDPPYVYVAHQCSEFRDEDRPAHFVFSDELRRAAREVVEDAVKCQQIPSMYEGYPVERLASALVISACVALSVSSNGHAKVLNAPGCERLFDDGPHDEVLATIQCIRDGEGKELELTRGAMFDSFYGRAAEYYGVATLEMRRLVVTHVQGLRCPDTYPNYIQAVVLPCLDCGGRDTSYGVNKAPNSFNEAKCLDEECHSS
ncbi:MAG: hypothetical protein IJV69_00435, partial [Kiritimatiellae bacterium]|nr:hypothetical protein [Kiritimatiellia bacterium]